MPVADSLRPLFDELLTSSGREVVDDAAPQSASLSLDLARTRRAGQGDQAAQTWLLQQVLPTTRRVARAFLRGSTDADDAAQLSLLAILRSASTYRGDAPLASWANRIAVRTTLRFVRDQRRRAQTAAPDCPEEIEAPPARHAFEALPRRLPDYLRELPEVQREAIILHHALDHSLEEIAELTEVSADTVKSRLRLGTAALRKRVRQELVIGARRGS